MGERSRGQLCARTKGGDTDQIRAVAAGECDVTIGNTYYFARLLKSNAQRIRQWLRRSVIFPNQSGANGRGRMSMCLRRHCALRTPSRERSEVP